MSLTPPHADPAAAFRPLISVIVRSMDRASLAQALDSVAAQSWPAVEVVVVNARGSAHGPLPAHCGGFEIVAANAGGAPLQRARAANCGLDAAQGALALFLDDDDLLLPDHLARLAAALQAAPQAPAAFADVEMGCERHGVWQPLHVFDGGFDTTRLWFENYLPIHAVLFRHADSTLRFDESFDLFEDWDFWLQLAARGDFVHVPGVSARYRVNDIGVMGVEQSNVFADSPQATAARGALFGKWQARIDPTQHAGLLMRLQSAVREAADHRAQRALAAITHTNLQAVVGARDAEIAEAIRLHAGLEAIVAERERELADAHAHNTELERIVAARNRDAAAAATHIASLEQTLAARDREGADAQAHAAGLNAIVAARDHDIAQAAAHAAALADIVAAREAEIAAYAMQIASLHEALAQAQQALQLLKKERPLQALQRTLKKRHEPGPG